MTVPKVSIYILFCNFSCVFLECPESVNLSNALTRKQRFWGYLFKTHTNVNTWVSCARLCLLRSLCKSFNYNEGTQNCEVNWKAASLEAGTTLETSWLYGEASKIPQSILEACSNHGCEENQVCAPVGEGGHTCFDMVSDVCSSEKSIDGASFSIEAREYTCQSDRVAKGDARATCNYTGTGFQWTADLTCHDTRDCYVLVNGVAIYSGDMNVTYDGRKCENWNDVGVLSLTGYTDASLQGLSAPSVGLQASMNFCRSVKRNAFLYYPVIFDSNQGVVVLEFWCSGVPECSSI